MDVKDIKEVIQQEKIIAILRGLKEENLLPIAEALLEGGIKCIEITLNPGDEGITRCSLRMLEKLKESYPEKICLGAGTVVNEKDVKRAVESGADYIISPNFSPEVIDKTKYLEKVSIPGVATPSEAVNAYREGADFVKFFPATSLGPAYMKALQGPIGHIPVLAVGGVNLQNVKNFIQAGAAGVGVGGGLLKKQAIDKEDYQQIKELARQFKNKLV